jgi:hypothetical protein
MSFVQLRVVRRIRLNVPLLAVLLGSLFLLLTPAHADFCRNKTLTLVVG